MSVSLLVGRPSRKLSWLLKIQGEVLPLFFSDTHGQAGRTNSGLAPWHFPSHPKAQSRARGLVLSRSLTISAPVIGVLLPELFRVRARRVSIYFDIQANSGAPGLLLRIAKVRSPRSPRLYFSYRRFVDNFWLTFVIGAYLQNTPAPALYFSYRRMVRLYPALTRRAVSSTDGPGGIYVYEIPRYQPNCPKRRCRRALTRREIKIGRAIDPPKRRKQWLRQCRGQRQIWWFYWEVPLAKKFGESAVTWNAGSVRLVAEALLHNHFKREGAWIWPHECDWCTVYHREKIDLEDCGGRRGIIRVAEGYHKLLGWPIFRNTIANN
ncbi:hypothetical protein B0H17DRAFT_1148769 [Mycena rosella]|uniref:Uncharacterized protein n=1 Tax=Mycena rosella TaxID=1033263 RepID=A0AAD7FXJ2_MYCRO|nr:hypothetical protein B0H17DRAFT_1148769 [Mycena rosella]